MAELQSNQKFAKIPNIETYLQTPFCP